MKDDLLNLVRKSPQLEGLAGRLPKPASKSVETDEESCSAFGYLRGLHEKALAIEFQMRTGDKEYFPYAWLGPWRYNPSTGLLLKFSGDVASLVLIRGSNLDAPVNQSGVNLTDKGLQRHRVSWVREMEKDELQRAGEGTPTIDTIEIAEFESGEELREWVKKNARAFVR